MSEDFTPDTQPEGSLVPPNSNPPTAVAAAEAPLPARRPSLPRMHSSRGIGYYVERMLDTLDDLGDTIARVARLRRSPAPPGT